MGRIAFAAIVGLGGVAVLIWLGLWQVDRLAWKRALLTDISERIAAAPSDLPAVPDPEGDRYLSVAVEGVFGDRAMRVLVSQKQLGAAWRIVQAFETVDGRRILVDRGIVPSDVAGVPDAEATEVVGNLLWPDEIDGFTPAPDIAGNIWYARDVPTMAAEAGTDAVLIVARSQTGGGVAPLPVGITGIPNDHLQYALTWFSLALVWAGMTGLWLWRIWRPKTEEWS